MSLTSNTTTRGARVIAQSPLVPERGPELRRMVWGRLVRASDRELAFATDERVAAGEALELSVTVPATGPCLSGALAHIVATTRCDGETVAYCRFDDPGQPTSWLAALER